MGIEGPGAIGDQKGGVKLVVGLGNPGKKYARTPHNAGFMVIDELASRLSCTLRRSLRCRAQIGRVTRPEGGLLLAKPETYMNNSGEAVAAILGYYRIEPTDMIVVLDDADLEIGRIRVRAKGSSGGHRGLDSVIGAAGTNEFARVRIGIGRNREKDLVDHVLTPVSAEEMDRWRQSAKLAADAVWCALERGAAEAMNRFNGVKTAAQETTSTTVEKPN
jgi:PTH1 family peptidyl-tRNA hydrolase